MHSFRKGSLLLPALLWLAQGLAQGPPVWMDKPIMLGSRKGTLRLTNLYRVQPALSFNALQVMADYNLNEKLELGLNQPLVHVSSSSEGPGRWQAGDLALSGKYQFIRKDAMARTFRVAAKLTETLPFGEDLDAPVAGWGAMSTSAELVAAYESLKLGLGAQVGVLMQHQQQGHRMATGKVGVGIPLLKPVYPVRQVNVYLDLDYMQMLSESGYGLYLGQALQYAYRKYVFEAGLQWPLQQSLPDNLRQQISVLAGARMIF